MAETAVNILLEQLATLLLQEAKLLSGAKAGVAAIQKDLEMIRAFLVDADRKQQTEEVVKEWVKQVRDTAYDIEDTLDDFFYRMELLERPSGPGLAGFLRKNTRFFRRIAARHRVANKVQDLRSRLRDISERKSEFSLAEAGSGGSTAATTNLDQVSRLAAQFVEESQVVGIEKPRDELIEWLLVQKRQYAVISVSGMGGVGKTTLVRKVYQDPKVKNHFDCNAWVTVSQTFAPEDLLRSMIEQLEGKRDEQLRSMAYIKLVETLRSHLKEKRYVIVLDDVWSVKDWEVIICALPENKSGSRIVVTTRDSNVATHCSKHKESIYVLKPLQDEEAWSLLCKKVFGAESESNSCPEVLEPVARNILEVCRGLPLAIVAIAGVLLTKPQAVSEWETIYHSIRSELKSGVENILGLSYNNLPPHLKPCFLYFGMFPDDYEVRTSMMTRLWIAEGFIKPMQDKSLERISEEYLTELVQRSLVQASKSDYLGRVRRCRVHDLVHDLIISKSKEQNFHLSLPQGRAELLPDNVRRFVTSSGQESVPQASTHLRSLFLLEANRIPLLSTFRALKVLHIKAIRLGDFPTEIFDLFHLRYLYLYYIRLPQGISRLKNLQTLHLESIGTSSLPNEVLELKNLRHVIFSQWGEVQMPTKLGNLTSLQTLAEFCVTGGAEQLKELGKLTQLKKLYIRAKDGEALSAGEALCAAIKNMSQLQSLGIAKNMQREPLNIENLSFSSPFLRKIYIYGDLPPEFILPRLNCLEKLRLHASNLKTDPFSFLQHFPSLLELYLVNDVYGGEEILSESRGFQKLKKLLIDCHPGLRRIVIDQGAMPNLEYLAIERCRNIESVPIGIEHLRNLKELSLRRVSDVCINRMRNEAEDWNKVKHIPVVLVDGSVWHA